MAQLTLERARLSTTLDSLMDPHVMFEAVRDRDGTVIDFVFADANDAAIEYNHSTREKMIGGRLLDILPGHKRSGVFATYVHALETGEPMILDDSVYFNEIMNSERHCDVRALKVGDGLSYTWRDVTERLQLMEKYRLLAENASDVVYETDAEGSFKWVSPSASRILEWDPDDLLGTSSFDIIFDEDLPKVHAHRRRTMKGEFTQAIEARYRSSSGDLHWMSVSARPARDSTGNIEALIVGLRSIDAEVATRHSLAASESHFRLLAENSSDVVLESNFEGLIKWISPSAQQVLGWLPRFLVGTRSLDLVALDDFDKALVWQQRVRAGEKIESAQLRIKTSGGDLRWMTLRAQAARDEEGHITGGIIGMSDCQSEVVAQRAANTLSAGSRVLVRSEREEDLLVQMCQAAVDEGGYLLAWYGRRVDDAQHSVVKVAMSREHRDYVEGINVDWSEGPNGQGPVGKAMKTGEAVVYQDLATDPNFAPWRKWAKAKGFRSCVGLPVYVDGEIDGSLQVLAGERGAFDDHVVDVLKDLTDELGYGLKRLRDHERLMKSLNDQALLSSAIDQASESIVITDPDSTILYANPSAVRTSEYQLEEILGANPRLFQSELHDDTFFQIMWAHLHGGEPWHGTLINRRKSGELYEEDSTISPVHDGDGNLLAYVAVKRDLTVEQRLETHRTREQHDRLAILDIMQEVRRADSLRETAEAFCRAGTNLTSIDAALLVLVQADGTLLTIGTGGEQLGGAASGSTLEFPRPEYLIERSNAGAWWLDLNPNRIVVDDEFTARMIEGGFTTVGNVPIRWEGELVGILALASKDPEGPSWMASRLPVFEELGSYAGALFGAEAEVFSKVESLRSEILSVIKDQRFKCVFQPFVNLETGSVVGYEALTRFDGGERPDLRFLQAHSVGLGSELEALCAQTALEIARELPSDIWLSLNFSPAAIIDGHAAKVVSGVTRHLVIEVTEHAQINNYAAIRKAFKEIGNCQLAVDDAGAGYTSLSHILELQPDFVKLDISMVRGVDTDPARQAMVAGMCHFASQSHTTLIAEGIETKAEAEMLRQLGVPLGEAGMLGQGYLFGRPKPLK
ncbi:MAG TPA: PAS domain S-box protein [Acidimicrobiales bacterium]|jgi:PAS domain S-box-containing protein|nr:PAS domain S-box protein [Acidimicrobiales bacterium]